LKIVGGNYATDIERSLLTRSRIRYLGIAPEFKKSASSRLSEKRPTTQNGSGKKPETAYYLWADVEKKENLGKKKSDCSIQEAVEKFPKRRKTAPRRKEGGAVSGELVIKGPFGMKNIAKVS